MQGRRQDPDPKGCTTNCFPKRIVRKANKKIVHENYDRNTYKNDIALIRLDNPVPLYYNANKNESGVIPVCIPWNAESCCLIGNDSNNSRDVMSNGVNLHITGWGTNKIKRRQKKAKTTKVVLVWLSYLFLVEKTLLRCKRSHVQIIMNI